MGIISQIADLALLHCNSLFPTHSGPTRIAYGGLQKTSQYKIVNFDYKAHHPKAGTFLTEFKGTSVIVFPVQK